MNDAQVCDHSDVCRWLAQLFLYEVTDDQLVPYQAGAAAPFLDRMADVGKTDDARKRFEAAIQELFLLDTPRLSLAADYAALFLLGEKNNAQPYAGLWSLGDGQVFGVTHDKMVERYAAQNLQLALPTNEPADHISFMLEYLSILLSSPLEDSAERPADFLNSEVLPWIESWCEAVESVPVKSAFYPSLADLSLHYLQGIAKTLASPAALEEMTMLE